MKLSSSEEIQKHFALKYRFVWKQMLLDDEQFKNTKTAGYSSRNDGFIFKLRNVEKIL